jgi:hypothetical protein
MRKQTKEPQIKFSKWLDKFIVENAIDKEQVLIVTGPSGDNRIPVRCIIEALKSAPVYEQDELKKRMAKINSCNAKNIFMAFLGHMGQLMAV